MKRALPFVLLALVQPAHASLSPCVTDDLMREAVLVIQAVDLTVAPIGTNLCSLQGTVATVHRGDVQASQSVTAQFSCLTDPSSVGIGGTTYINTESVANAGAVELHFNRDGFIAAGGQGLIALDQPTQSITWEPHCS